MISITCNILESPPDFTLCYISVFLKNLGGIKCEADDPTLKGWRRYFNSTTLRGRANTAKATYGVVFVGLLLWYGKSKIGNKEGKSEDKIK